MSAATDKFVAFVKRNPIGVGCAVVSIALGATLYLRWDKADSAQTSLEEKEKFRDKYQLNKANAGTELTQQLERLVEDNKAITTDRLVSLQKGGTIYQRYFFRLKDDVPGLDILEFTPGATSKSALGPAAFTLALKGTYGQVMNALRRLETGVFFCRVTNLTLSIASVGNDVKAEDNDQVVMRLNLELLGQQ